MYEFIHYGGTKTMTIKITESDLQASQQPQSSPSKITVGKEGTELVKKIEIKRSRLNDEVNAFNNSANSIESIFESIVRGALGDPFGKAQEIMQEEKMLKSKLQDFDIATQNEIEEFTKRGKKIETKKQEVIHQLERIVTQYNVKFNCF